MCFGFNTSSTRASACACIWTLSRSGIFGLGGLGGLKIHAFCLCFMLQKICYLLPLLGSGTGCLVKLRIARISSQDKGQGCVCNLRFRFSSKLDCHRQASLVASSS